MPDNRTSYFSFSVWFCFLFCAVFLASVFCGPVIAQARLVAQLAVPAMTGLSGNQTPEQFSAQTTEQPAGNGQRSNANSQRVKALQQQSPPPGAGWEFQATTNQPLVSRFVAVDKSQQKIMLYEHKSPLRMVSSFICTTGQIIGDKKVEGDLRTPEGIYFVVQRIGNGLNYELYGNEAYTLNYPNPVDRLRRKTGYGIWIHGRGYDITPLETQGCVAMNNGDLTVFAANLKPGLPVALADVVKQTNGMPSGTDEQTTKRLRENVKGWANAWGSRSVSMFDFYDPEAYSVTQEPFSQFKAQKERLFKMLPWIKNNVSNVNVMKGPGYWVTWFFQDYKAPNLETKGVRRLYWQENNKGDLRIVGMEWLPGLTMDGGVLVASADDPGGEQPKAQGPLRAEGGPIIIEGKDAPQKQTQVAAGPEKVAAPEVKADNKAEAKKAEDDKTAKGKQDKSAEVKQFVESWRKAWEAGDLNAYAKFYAKDAVQGSRKGQASIKSQKQTLWANAKPSKVNLGNIRIAPASGGLIKVEMTQIYKDKKGQGDKGTKTLHLKAVGKNLEIVREDWRE